MSPTTKAKAKANTPQPLQSLDWIYKMDVLDVDSTRFVVRKGGKIPSKEAPALLRLHPNDVVAWFITNDSGEKITVSFRDFTLKLKNKKIDPVVYTSGNPVSIQKGETRVVYGIIKHTPENKFFPDFVKYTIRVTGQSFGTIDYDPDLEIKP